MKNLKKLTSVFLAVIMLLAMNTTAFATVSDTGFSDVAANAWYADAVTYVRGHGLMSGTSTTTFSPEATTSRGQIAAILYRAAGSPAVTGGTDFPDVANTAYYADATRWASANGIVSGYPNGNFGPNDSITRQQFAAILWRYAGSPAASRGQDFADESSISSYSSTAVDWAHENGIINGKGGNIFDPDGNATRAQAAVILRNFMEQNTDQPDISGGSKVLVAYFSATNTTEGVAEHIANSLNADLYEIVPEEPYTDADLNYNDNNSRSTLEMNDPSARPAISSSVENMEQYDIVFIGYPIWWGEAPRIVSTFMESYDFSGKTIVPFCTSGGSGVGSSVKNLENLTSGATFTDGQRLNGNASRDDVTKWIDDLNLSISTK